MASIPATLIPELLVEIFRAVLDHHNQQVLKYFWPKYFPFWDAYKAWESLVGFTLVCQHWRETALRAAILWRDVCVGDGSPLSRRISQLLLDRSGQVTLRLTLIVRDTVTGDIPTIIAALHRVERLQICLTKVMTMTTPEPYLRALASPTALHNLRELYVGLDPSAVGGVLDVPFAASHHLLEKLEVLHVKHVRYLEVCCLFRRNLRVLRVEYTHGQVLVQGLLQALANMPLLEEIILRSISNVPSTQARHAVTQLPVIALPHLRRIKVIDDDLQRSCNLLDNLHFPSNVVTTSGVHFGLPNKWFSHNPNPLEDLQGFLVILSKLAGHGIIGTIPLARHLALTILEGQCGVRIEAYASVADPIAPFFICRARNLVLSLGHCLDGLCSLSHDAFLAGVQQLTLRAEEDCIDMAFSNSVSKLKNLQVLYLENAQRVCEALVQARTISYATGIKEYPFPSLRILTFSTVIFRFDSPDDEGYGRNPDELIWQLLEMVEARYETGRPLETLAVRKSKHFGQEDVEVLGVFVARVDWDGKILRSEDDFYES
ncbi:hypothetical protein BXZ70DRAFT_81196 [Cristinia sonorae]|uniref:F-box domain-containing protein n=1 Tax=Cristinia sonorae TaxID=1940300 RepID=A0A8K0URQ3_9AGAR|nr:hypothetical protein BXZ70DRAFT_81196 [Cristinia sonorae]